MKPTKRKLTKKQRAFVKHYALTENGLQSALAAGYDVKSRDVAKFIGHENITKPYIMEAVKKEQKSLAERLPDDLLEKRHLELLNKRELAIVKRSGDVGDSPIFEVLDQPDTLAVSKGLDMAFKLKGSYAPEKTFGVHVAAKIEDVPKLERLRIDYETKLKQELNADAK